jgi:DNA polymerase V
MPVGSMSNAKVIPINSQQLEHLDFDCRGKLEIPFFSHQISCGFPSPSSDYSEDRIDIGKYLVQNPTSTFMMRVEGNSMVDANIHEDDILVIDKSLKASDGMASKYSPCL